MYLFWSLYIEIVWLYPLPNLRFIFTLPFASLHVQILDYISVLLTLPLCSNSEPQPSVPNLSSNPLYLKYGNTWIMIEGRYSAQTEANILMMRNEMVGY